jgi:hypothetical protein
MIGNILIWTILRDSKQRQIINLLEEKFHIISDFYKAFPENKLDDLYKKKPLANSPIHLISGNYLWNWPNAFPCEAY